jgi:hypothetical protein
VISDVLGDISERGGNITSVMEMEETVWENREISTSIDSPTAPTCFLEPKLFQIHALLASIGLTTKLEIEVAPISWRPPTKRLRLGAKSFAVKRARGT